MLKQILGGIVGLMLLADAHAQPNAVPKPGTGFSPGLNADLPRFDLDFPGGGPEVLMQFINEKLHNSPVNAIIPSEYENVEIPRMRLKNVTVEQVFTALRRASEKQFPVIVGNRVQYDTMFYSFETTSPIQTNSVWFFFYNKPAAGLDPKICRFYQLGPYLRQQEMNVNDITTAIKAGYKMLGESGPELNFHEETKLLIACGPASQMTMIEEVLQALPKGNASVPGSRPPIAMPTSAASPQTAPAPSAK